MKIGETELELILNLKSGGVCSVLASGTRVSNN